MLSHGRLPPADRSCERLRWANRMFKKCMVSHGEIATRGMYMVGEVQKLPDRRSNCKNSSGIAHL